MLMSEDFGYSNSLIKEEAERGLSILASSAIWFFPYKMPTCFRQSYIDILLTGSGGCFVFKECNIFEHDMCY